MAKYIQTYKYWNNGHTKLFQYGDKVVWNDNQETETPDDVLNEINSMFELFKFELKEKIENKATELIKQTLQIKYNSNAILGLDNTNLEEKLTNTYNNLNRKIINNSNAIIQNERKIRWTSTTIINSDS